MLDRFAFSRRALLGATALSAAAPAAAAVSARPIYRDPAASIPARVSDLISRMTLEEKAAQICSRWTNKPDFLDARKQFSPEKARVSLGHGIGQIARPSDIRGYPEWEDHPFRSIPETVALINAIQRFLIEQTRLGIPAMFHDELLHGLLANDATIFPSPPALGSTWDPELVEAVFAAAANEARARGTHVALSPVVDLARDPRYGRVEEMFGEDPRHVAEMGVAAVRGLQGQQRPLGPDRVFATLKHLLHAVPQGGLNVSPAEVSERGMRENFLVPFFEIVRRADPAAIMPSYNEVQGMPSHANIDLLQRIGRRLLGFKGAYFGDYDAIGNLVEQHHMVATKKEAAEIAIKAGVEADLPDGSSYVHLPELVREGRVPEAAVDAAVAKVLALKFEAGLFERPFVDQHAARRSTRTPAHLALALRAAEKSLVLLKNDGILPLPARAGMRLAVIGPNAAEPLYGNYSGFTPGGVGILDGVRRAAPAGLVIEHAEGVMLAPPDVVGRHRTYSPLPPIPEQDDKQRIAEAVELASRSDVLLLVLGDIPAVTREAVAWELPGDRSTLNLWGRQDQLVEAMIATGKPIIAVLLNGRPLAVARLAEKANALVEAWYPGEQAGTAFAAALFGTLNPGGKLGVSFPRSVGELPVYYNRHPSADHNRYLEGKREALFPFGHGLSYTTFEISPPRLRRAQIAAGEPVELEVEVANTGTRAGDEVVQVYIRDELSSAPRPILELKAFRRVGLAAGERRTLGFRLEAGDLAFWDAEMNRSVEPGTFLIYAGSSSAQLKSTLLTVTGPVAHV